MMIYLNKHQNPNIIPDINKNPNFTPLFKSLIKIPLLKYKIKQIPYLVN